ncbi:MAG: DUF2318 domain-containing protein [Desulfobacterales bacterium]|jgi:uncharacterized membrane protein
MSKRSVDRPNNQTDLIARKKEAVLGSSRKPVSGQMIIAVLIVIIAGGAAVMIAIQGSGGQTVPEPGDAPRVAADARIVTYPVTAFDDGKARHYEFVAGDTTIRYFIIKSADGVIRAAFDACDVCWPAGKGYVQDGDVMVCRNCSRRFASHLVNEVQGGCNPAPLNRAIEGDRLVITTADILDGAGYFDFKEGNKG